MDCGSLRDRNSRRRFRRSSAQGGLRCPCPSGRTWVCSSRRRRRFRNRRRPGRRGKTRRAAASAGASRLGAARYRGLAPGAAPFPARAAQCRLDGRRGRRNQRGRCLGRTRHNHSLLQDSVTGLSGTLSYAEREKSVLLGYFPPFETAPAAGKSVCCRLVPPAQPKPRPLACSPSATKTTAPYLQRKPLPDIFRFLGQQARKPSPTETPKSSRR